MMERRAVTLLLIAGICTLSSCLPRQYHHVNVPMGWTNAQSYCRRTYTDLVTVGSSDVTTKVMETTGTNVSGNVFWIGLYDDYRDWVWTLSYSSVVTSRDLGYRNWYSNQPNEQALYCVVMYNNSEFAQWNCDALLPSVCTAGSTFVFIPESMTWSAASSNCRRYYTNLATVRNSSDNQVVNHMMPEGVDRVWIGLHRDPYTFWSDGGATLYSNWYPGQPLIVNNFENCAAASVTYGGQWISDSCLSNHTFVCYHDVPVKQRQVKMKLTPVDSKLNLNDPAVIKVILQQVNQRLQTQGVTEYFTLTWRRQPDGDVFHRKEGSTG